MFEGKAIIFSAPSGSGKTTIVQHLLHKFDFLGFSVSATTRPARSVREQDGRDYYFLTTDDFRSRIERNEFIEWEEVYHGTYYGTLLSEVERLWGEGKHVLFDVDVKGGLRLKNFFQDRALAVFVRVASMEELEKRLRHRNTESEAKLRERLEKAAYEMSFESQFDRSLLSSRLDYSLGQAERLVLDFLNI